MDRWTCAPSQHRPTSLAVWWPSVSPVDSQTFGWGPLLDERWRRVVAVRREPVKIGHQRAPSPMDTLIVFTAEHHGLTVPPVDGDFAAIAKVRPGIPMIRLQPRTNDGPHSR
ncbi:hypothetical protein ACFV2U_19120 [Streptomyces sp. NPDC059697]|uniref:hypothetical protein n=1 Tax=Streptomyces sp. NPDC059697 TaxID=3346912 RepID=UPI00367E7162